MKIKVFWVLLLLLKFAEAEAQEITISGNFIDAFTQVPLPQVKVSIENTFYETASEESGSFLLKLNDVLQGNYILRIDKTGYELKRIPVQLGDVSRIELGFIQLRPDVATEVSMQQSISLSDSELQLEDSESDNISGILQSGRDVFSNAAAFDFGQTFFRPRGLGSEYGKVLINGLEMNKDFDGRPQWSNWGGLNDVQRNQEFSLGTQANDFQFGGLGGLLNISMRASKYQQGGRVTSSFSNRSYTGRLMATYASGEKGKGWYYAVSAGRRAASEGYIDGTVYDANSFFVAVEKSLDDQNAISLSAFYTPVTRGRSAPLTNELIALKGRTYNPYWGFQDDAIRNARLRSVKEPVIILNHFWNAPDHKLSLQSGIFYQFGESFSSRIDYGGSNLMSFGNQNYFEGGGYNPDPSYYQKLPSYFFRFEDDVQYEQAYHARQDLETNGQLDWNELYQANRIATLSGKNSIYALAEEVNRDKRLGSNIILNWNLNSNFKFHSAIEYQTSKSLNFSRIGDLLGGIQFLDVDLFTQGFDAAQSNLQNPDRLVREGDVYKYHYEISSGNLEGFSQVAYQKRRILAYFGINAFDVCYQRNGLFQNGLYPENSLGESEKIELRGLGFKSGLVYKISGSQNLEFNASWFQKPPAFRNTFINARQNNRVVPGIGNEKIRSADLSYRLRSPFLNIRTTLYAAEITNATEVSFYFAEGISGLERENNSAFVQEILTDLDKRYYGLEFGIEVPATSSLKFKAVAAIGENRYAENANLQLYASTAINAIYSGETYLKNYHLPGGPQQAYQLGFEYSDTDYWWFGATVNHFRNAFVDINPLTRTLNFQQDYDGLPLVEYDESEARDLLIQEKLPTYYLVNATGGKSWRIKKTNYLGLFISLNNILDEFYKTGGFEQARNANFRELKEDRQRQYPLFGNKYWLGQGTSYFINLNYRFK